MADLALIFHSSTFLLLDSDRVHVCVRVCVVYCYWVSVFSIISHQ